MNERPTVEGQKSMESEQPTKPIVLRCIDFRTDESTRTWLKDQGLEDGQYYLYASAGASGNPNGFLETVRVHSPQKILVVDHQDCGYYKKGGDDSPKTHRHNLEILGQSLQKQNPSIDYQYHFLPVKDARETCSSTAIILGEPDMVKAARQKLTEFGLANSHDEIARPYSLSPRDQTIWDDLKLSLDLHGTTKILLFDKDTANVKMLMQKIKQIAGNIHVEPIILAEAA